MYTKSKDKFKNKLKGLTSKEALERLNKDGFNELNQKNKRLYKIQPFIFILNLMLLEEFQYYY